MAAIRNSGKPQAVVFPCVSRRSVHMNAHKAASRLTHCEHDPVYEMNTSNASYIVFIYKYQMRGEVFTTHTGVPPRLTARARARRARLLGPAFRGT
jgi:hypothetical protein